VEDGAEEKFILMLSFAEIAQSAPAMAFRNEINPVGSYM
jgi:hypothetical protein